jgi:hypothetical protein
VVEQGRRAIGRMIEVTVTSVLQLPAGKMIFCKWPEGLAAAQADGEPRQGGRAPDRRDPRNGRDYRGDSRRESDRAGERVAAVADAPRPSEIAVAQPAASVPSAPSASPAPPAASADAAPAPRSD